MILVCIATVRHLLEILAGDLQISVAFDTFLVKANFLQFMNRENLQSFTDRSTNNSVCSPSENNRHLASENEAPRPDDFLCVGRD